MSARRKERQVLRAREIAVPRALRELHGERTTLFDLLLVYITAAAFGVIAVVFARSRVDDFPWWKALLLFVMAADTSGGVVAGFSASTNRYYARRPGMRWFVIFGNVISPAVLYALFGGSIAWWIFVYVYTAAAASIVNVLTERGMQEVAAAAFLAVGVVITLPLGLAAPFLAWFAPLYMVKLILAFAVRRT